MDDKFILELLTEVIELLNEGAVKTNNSEKGIRNKYLKQHDYDPETKTIRTRNGDRVHFDNTKRNKTEASYEPKKGISISDKDMKHHGKFRKCDSEHESTHMKLHSPYEHVDHDKNKHTTDKIISDFAMIASKNNADMDDVINVNKKIFDKEKERSKNARDTKSKNHRTNNYMEWAKYSDFDIMHKSPVEFEGDAGAAANTSVKDTRGWIKKMYKEDMEKYSGDYNTEMGKTIRNINNQVKKGNWSKEEAKENIDYIKSLSKKEFLEMIHNRIARKNRELNDIMNTRLKALKDKNINYSVYRKKSQNECIAELLIETAKLLEEGEEN